MTTPPPAVETPAATTAPPPVEEPPSAVRQVGDTLKTVTDQLPIVGAPTGQVVDGVIDTVDTLLKP